MAAQKPAHSKIEQLREEIRRLKEEMADREAALPAHSIRPHQLLIIEELEEEISRKQEELKALEAGSGPV
jgi:archaellum component FlaC